MQLKMEAKKTKTLKQKTPTKGNVKPSAEEKKINQVLNKKPTTPQNEQAGLPKINKKRNRSRSNTRTEGKLQQNNQNITTDSEKKRKNLNRVQNENKKQKIDFDKSKKVNTDAEQGLTQIKVIFPRSGSCKDALLKILETCEGVTFVPPLTFRFNPEEIQQKIEEIKKIKIEGEPLTVVNNSSKAGLEPLKRVIPLKVSGADTNAVMKFFDAKAIDQIMTFRGTPTPLYVLTFASEKTAAAASQKNYELNGKRCYLRQYHKKENTNATKNLNAANKDTRKENVKTEPQVQQEKKLTKKEPKKKEEPVKQEEEEEEEEEDSDDEVDLEGSDDDLDDELDGSDDDNDGLDGEKMADIDMGDDDEEDDDDDDGDEEEDDDDDEEDDDDDDGDEEEDDDDE